MKVCIFCREEIHDDATKCRFCLSSFSSKTDSEIAVATQTTGPRRIVYSVDRDLVGWAKIAVVVLAFFVAAGVFLYLYGFNTHQAGPRPDQVTYVVDQGLVRFAKFAAAVLAVFVTVGVFLYGFNLKEVAKEIRQMAESMTELHRQAMITNDEIRNSKDAVSADRAESKKLLDETRDSIASTRAELEKINAEVDENRNRLDRLLKQGESSISEFQSKVALLVVSTKTMASGKKPAAVEARCFTVPELAKIYEFPPELDGRGQCIGLIELGGGYKQSDLKTYFNRLGIPMPKVTPVSVDGAKNKPTDVHGIDSQVTLDIQVAGAVAPGAHIVVYFAPNTDQGFIDAVEMAVHDTTNRPSVLSISWGAPEPSWVVQTITKFDQVFQSAAKAGITIVCATGDNGVTDGVEDGQPHVDFPASSPWVLACGGTRLTVPAQNVISEVVWNDGSFGTGGGVSNLFSRPDWQSGANVPLRQDGQQGRGIPDVAANASPDTGYPIYVHGKSMVVGGTAAGTPLWAGLIALLNQGVGRSMGHIHSVLYGDLGPAGILRSITEGNNGVKGINGYTAGPGWNACTGWGTPNGRAMLEALRSRLGNSVQ